MKSFLRLKNTQQWDNNMTASEIYKKAYFLSQKITPEEETIIASDPKYALLYAINVLNAPFKQGEQNILTNPEYAELYKKHFGSQIQHMESFNALYKEAVKHTNFPPINKKSRNIFVTGNVRTVISLINALEKEFNIEISGLSIKGMKQLSKSLENIKTFSVNFIKNSDLESSEKQNLVTQLLKCKTPIDFFSTLSYVR